MFIKDLQFLDRVDLASTITGGVSAKADVSTTDEPSATLDIESKGLITNAAGRIRIIATPAVNTALATGLARAYTPGKGYKRAYDRSYSRN